MGNYLLEPLFYDMIMSLLNGWGATGIWKGDSCEHTSVAALQNGGFIMGKIAGSIMLIFSMVVSLISAGSIPASESRAEEKKE